jgi:hypothetical protein
MAQLDSLLQQASTIQKQYQEGLQYKKQMGLLDKWSENERFKAGDQWPRATEKTKNLPRPVFNIIKQIQNHKVASVMNENLKMVFSAMDSEEDSTEYQAADTFTRYADTNWELIKQDSLNEEALESASCVGTGIWHYYFDSSIKGGNVLKYQGALKGEIIDPVNFFPGNPQNTDVQQQPYNIITYRDLVENVRKQAQDNGIAQEMVALIQPDSDTQDQAYDMAKKEITESNKVTVIVKYWKENDVMFFTKVASGIIFKPKTKTPLTLYPIVIMQWERRKRSIFGISDTEGLIPNQKAINFLMAMQLLSTQLTGWPKLLVDKTMVKQAISNAPGEVINVLSQAGHSIGNSVQYMNPVAMPAHTPHLIDSFLSYTKEVAGANENALGEQKTSQLNATAIMLLQKASGVPLESIKKRFYQAMEDAGRIWGDFWKGYYNIDRIITLKDDNNQSYTQTFNGSQHQNVDMNLKIDIGPSSSYSESLMMTSLDKLFDKGAISLEQYLTFAPNNVIPFKDRLLKSIQQQANDPNHILSQLTPQEQQAFYAAPPEQQQAILAQLQASQGQMQGQAPQQPVMAQQPNMPQQQAPMM